MASKDFLSQILSITFLSYLNSSERVSISLLMLSAKQGNFRYYFYYVIWSLSGDWTRDLPHSKPALYHQAIEEVVIFFPSNWLNKIDFLNSHKLVLLTFHFLKHNRYLKNGQLFYRPHYISQKNYIFYVIWDCSLTDSFLTPLFVGSMGGRTSEILYNNYWNLQKSCYREMIIKL